MDVGRLAVDEGLWGLGDAEDHEAETADGEGGFVLALETDTLDIVGWEDQQGPSALSELY